MRAKGHRVLSILLGSLLKFSAKVFQSQSLLNSWEMCVHVRSCRFVTFSFISDYQRGPIGMVTAAGVSAMITCSIQALHVPRSWIGISFSSWLERQGGCVVRGSHFTLDVGIGKDQQQGIAHFLSDQGKNVPAGAVTHAPGSGVAGQDTALPVVGLVRVCQLQVWLYRLHLTNPCRAAQPLTCRGVHWKGWFRGWWPWAVEGVL